METESNDFEIGIPNLGSLILTHSLEGQVTGLKDFAARCPNVCISLAE
jgi:cytochrome bd ubiquinol oxidase subunit I